MEKIKYIIIFYLIISSHCLAGIKEMHNVPHNVHPIETTYEILKIRADDGDAVAQFKLAIKFEEGINIDQNYEKAFKWYKLAAEAGIADACFKVAYYYDQGIGGVSIDYHQAIRWYTLAFEEGHKYASYNLGSMFYNGEVAEQNLIISYMFYTISSYLGLKIADAEKKELEYNLTIYQLKKAEELIDNCIRRDFIECF